MRCNRAHLLAVMQGVIEARVDIAAEADIMERGGGSEATATKGTSPSQIQLLHDSKHVQWLASLQAFAARPSVCLCAQAMHNVQQVNLRSL